MRFCVTKVAKNDNEKSQMVAEIYRLLKQMEELSNDKLKRM